MEEKQLSRRERERLVQRREILNAALDLFSEKGYHDTSMHEIAERSEFAIGTLYKFFKNKEDLYKALVREKAEEVFAAINEPLSAKKNALGIIEDYLRVRARIAAEIAPLLRMHMVIAQGVSLHVSRELEKELRELHAEHIARLAAVMEEGVRRKLLRRVEPFSLAVALDGLARGFLSRSTCDPERYPHESNVSVVLDLFFRGGIAEKPSQMPPEREADLAPTEHS